MVFDRVPPWPQEQTVSNSLPGEERGMRGSVCAEAGQGAWTRAAKWVGRADHRLRDCSPTASEGSEIFIRKPEVRDQKIGMPCSRSVSGPLLPVCVPFPTRSLLFIPHGQQPLLGID